MTKRCRQIAERLGEMYPDARPELDFTTPYELLVATVLSAQCTDKRVNMATAELFKVAGTPAKMKALGPEGIEPIIRSLGMYRQKAKNLYLAAVQILEEHGGQVPAERSVLETLPGVGAKTAAVVLANAFGEPMIAVDTHVRRVSQRLGLTAEVDPSKIEAELERQFERSLWTIMHHRLIFHGRRCCSARKPECPRCQLLELCPQKGVT